MSVQDLGCCGAYCGSCRVWKQRACKGCKAGYETGERDIMKAKCKIKVCCIKRKLQSCADCSDYLTCGIVAEFYQKNGFKYRKYHQAIEFIRKFGYAAFLEIADQWTNAYGIYDKKRSGEAAHEES